MRYGRLADEEAIRNLFVFESLRDQRDHFTFSIGESGDFSSFGINWLVRTTGQLPQQISETQTIEPDFPEIHFFDRFDQQLSRVFLQHDAHRAELDRFLMRLRVAHASQREHSCFACSFSQFGKHRKRARTAELEVQDDQIEGLTSDDLQGFGDRAHHCGDLYSGVVLD